MPEKFEQRISGWELAQLKLIPKDSKLPSLEGLDWISSKAPRAVQYDLMDAGLIKNVYGSSAAAKEAEWVPEADWLYKSVFDLSDEMLGSARVFIGFACIDTFSDVFVNGAYVGSTVNMFMPYRFDIKGASLKSRDNVLLVHIKGHGRMVADKTLRRIAEESRPHFARERALIRRHQRNYQPDCLSLGTAVVGIGLVREVDIASYPQTYISDFEFIVRNAKRRKGAGTDRYLYKRGFKRGFRPYS